MLDSSDEDEVKKMKKKFKKMNGKEEEAPSVCVGLLCRCVSVAFTCLYRCAETKKRLLLP